VDRKDLSNQKGRQKRRETEGGNELYWAGLEQTRAALTNSINERKGIVLNTKSDFKRRIWGGGRRLRTRQKDRKKKAAN